MGIFLLNALDKYYSLVGKATTDSTIVVPPEHAFVPGAEDDLDLGYNLCYYDSSS
jgi:hypothetical protein